MNTLSPQISPARIEDLGWIPRLIAEAFRDLPTSRWLVPDESRRVPILEKNFEMWTRHAWQHGHIDLVSPDADGRGAVAVWFHVDPDKPMRRPVYYQKRLEADCGDRAWHFQTLDELFDRHHPMDSGPHHYLAFLAASRPNTGLGGALVEHHLRTVLDPTDHGAYLVAATTDSARLYDRHAFCRIGDGLHLPGGTEPMWPMWRKPEVGTTTPAGP